MGGGCRQNSRDRKVQSAGPQSSPQCLNYAYLLTKRPHYILPVWLATLLSWLCRIVGRRCRHRDVAGNDHLDWRRRVLLQAGGGYAQALCERMPGGVLQHHAPGPHQRHLFQSPHPRRRQVREGENPDCVLFPRTMRGLRSRAILADIGRCA